MQTPSRRGRDLESRSTVSKTNKKPNKKQPDSFPVPHTAFSPCSSAPARVSGARSPAGGEGRGGWSLGAPNQQPAPAVAPVTSEALPPPHCGRTPGAASHPNSRPWRGGARGAGAVRVRSRSPGKAGQRGGHAHARSGAVAGGGGGSSSVGDPKAEGQAGGRCRRPAPLPRPASPR